MHPTSFLLWSWKRDCSNQGSEVKSECTLMLSPNPAAATHFHCLPLDLRPSGPMLKVFYGASTGPVVFLMLQKTLDVDNEVGQNGIRAKWHTAEKYDKIQKDQWDFLFSTQAKLVLLKFLISMQRPGSHSLPLDKKAVNATLRAIKFIHQ